MKKNTKLSFEHSHVKCSSWKRRLAKETKKEQPARWKENHESRVFKMPSEGSFKEDRLTISNICYSKN